MLASCPMDELHVFPQRAATPKIAEGVRAALLRMTRGRRRLGLQLPPGLILMKPSCSSRQMQVNKAEPGGPSTAAQLVFRLKLGTDPTENCL